MHYLGKYMNIFQIKIYPMKINMTQVYLNIYQFYHNPQALVYRFGEGGGGVHFLFLAGTQYILTYALKLNNFVSLGDIHFQRCINKRSVYTMRRS